MNTLRQYVLTTLISVSLCGAAQAHDTLQSDVDQSFLAVSSAVTDAGLNAILEIDHARLAAAEGVEMPPSRVQLFSDPRINAAILKQEIRAGLDLPTVQAHLGHRHLISTLRYAAYGDETASARAARALDAIHDRHQHPEEHP